MVERSNQSVTLDWAAKTASGGHRCYWPASLPASGWLHWIQPCRFWSLVHIQDSLQICRVQSWDRLDLERSFWYRPITAGKESIRLSIQDNKLLIKMIKTSASFLNCILFLQLTFRLPSKISFHQWKRQFLGETEFRSAAALETHASQSLISYTLETNIKKLKVKSASKSQLLLKHWGM